MQHCDRQAQIQVQGATEHDGTEASLARRAPSGNTFSISKKILRLEMQLALPLQAREGPCMKKREKAERPQTPIYCAIVCSNLRHELENQHLWWDKVMLANVPEGTHNSCKRRPRVTHVKHANSCRPTYPADHKKTPLTKDEHTWNNTETHEGETRSINRNSNEQQQEESHATHWPLGRNRQWQ